MNIGDAAELTRSFTGADVEAFAALTGDINPIHLDDAYAATTRFQRRIVHGMLVSGLVSAVLGTRLPGPGAIYMNQSLKFTAPVYLDDAITARVELTSLRQDKPIATFKTSCRNAKGQIVLDGEATLLVAVATAK
jgi:3-hydroxybutyryl-CoA dehydratase